MNNILFILRDGTAQHANTFAQYTESFAIACFRRGVVQRSAKSTLKCDELVSTDRHFFSPRPEHPEWTRTQNRSSPVNMTSKPFRFV